MINKVGDRKDHHVNSEIIARKVLDDLDYNPKRKERVLKCVYNHRSSKNAESIEETCVADADILAHFDNIPMLFRIAFVRNNIELNDIRKWLEEAFEKAQEAAREEVMKTAVITGAAKGIGAAIAISFAKAGYRVVINYNKSCIYLK